MLSGENQNEMGKFIPWLNSCSAKSNAQVPVQQALVSRPSCDEKERCATTYNVVSGRKLPSLLRSQHHSIQSVRERPREEAYKTAALTKHRAD